jgi:hypothetical protein
LAVAVVAQVLLVQIRQLLDQVLLAQVAMVFQVQ